MKLKLSRSHQQSATFFLEYQKSWAWLNIVKLPGSHSRMLCEESMNNRPPCHDLNLTLNLTLVIQQDFQPK